MESFSDRLVRKREALLLLTHRPESPNDPKLDSIGLVPTVHYWLKILLKRGYTFNRILQESGVNPWFLERTYRELKLEDKVPDDLYQGSKSEARADYCGSKTENDGKRKDIEVEIRHFMFRTLLEMNRITASLQKPPVRERLRDDKIKYEVSNNLKRITEGSQELLKRIQTESETLLTDRPDIEKENNNDISERAPKRVKRENSPTGLKSGVESSEKLANRKSNSELWANNSSTNPDTHSSTSIDTPEARPNERIQTRQSKAQTFTPYRSLISNLGR